jgi:hypothetical protein
MNVSPWLEFIAVLSGSIFGAYLAVRVTLARMDEQIKGQRGILIDHASRIERLESEFFGREGR